MYVGILGGGGISETHARAAREINGVEIAAVCGQNEEKATRLAERYNAAAYTDVAAFLHHRPMNIVAIGSPSGLHAEQGVRAAQQNLHVLIEKPIDITTAQADRLIAVCEQARVKLGVFFQDRVAPDIRKLKEWIDDERLGRLISVSARVKWYRPPEYYSNSRWRGTWRLDGGGALMNQGVHTVDTLLWLMGDVRRVYAKAATLLHNIEVEDTVVATLEFTSGAIGTLEATTAAYPGYRRRIELTGSEGTVVVEHDRLIGVDLRHAAPESSINTEEENLNLSAKSPIVSDVRGHRKIFEDFINAIETDRPPGCDGHQGRRSVELVQAVYESSRTGQAVTLR